MAYIRNAPLPTIRERQKRQAEMRRKRKAILRACDPDLKYVDLELTDDNGKRRLGVYKFVHELEIINAEFIANYNAEMRRQSLPASERPLKPQSRRGSKTA